jgi:hypothetical protein
MMNYSEIRDVIIAALREYLTTNYFGLYSLFNMEWRGNMGKHRAIVLLDVLQVNSANITNARLLILLLAIMHSKSRKLKALIAQRIVNSYVMGKDISELMYSLIGVEDLQQRSIHAVMQICEIELAKLKITTVLHNYESLIAIISNPYGYTDKDIQGCTWFISELKIQ